MFIGLLCSTWSRAYGVFGLLLIGTAIQLFRHRDQDPEVEENAIARMTRRVLPVTEEAFIVFAANAFALLGLRRCTSSSPGLLDTSSTPALLPATACSYAAGREASAR